MANFDDLSGKRFNRLQVIARAENIAFANGRKRTAWVCRCDCGNECIVASISLKSGATASCGCLKAENNRAKWTKHNKSRSRLYGVWCDMKKRCYNPMYKQYNDYGGRGILVCDEWLHDFSAFEKFALEHGYDAEAKFGDCTIDRIDVNGNYSPENCRFVDMKTQNKNKRVTGHLLTYGKKTQNIAAWSRETGIHHVTICQRIMRGWTVEKALTTAKMR